MTSLSVTQGKPNGGAQVTVFPFRTRPASGPLLRRNVRGKSSGYGENVIDMQKARNRKQQGEKGLNAMLLNVMAYMAISDNTLDDQEIEAVRHCYKNFASEKVSTSQVQQLAENFHNTSTQLISELREVGPSLSKSDKEKIICAAYHVLLADGKIKAQEQFLLRKIAATLKMSEIHYQFVLEDFVAKTDSA